MPPTTSQNPKADPLAKWDRLRHWRDVALIGLGVLSVGTTIGHVLDWHAGHNPNDIKMAFGFLILLPLVFALSPRRFELLLGILLAIVLLGLVGMVLRQSPAGLPLIIPCGIAAYILLRWKGNQLIRK